MILKAFKIFSPFFWIKLILSLILIGAILALFLPGIKIIMEKEGFLALKDKFKKDFKNTLKEIISFSFNFYKSFFQAKISD